MTGILCTDTPAFLPIFPVSAVTHFGARAMEFLTVSAPVRPHVAHHRTVYKHHAVDEDFQRAMDSMILISGSIFIAFMVVTAPR